VPQSSWQAQLIVYRSEMPPNKKNVEMADHEISEHVARLESAMTVEERSAQLHSIRVERGLDDSLRVLLAYADRYPRGAVLLTPYFFVELAKGDLTMPEAVADVGLQEVAELTSRLQTVLRGG